MQVFPLGREVVPWPLSERFCSKSQGFPSPRLQNDGRRADFWGLGFSSPRLQNDGRRADFWRSEDSPPHVYRMLEEGQIVGVQGTPPSPRIQNAGGRADCWGPGRGAGVLTTPPAESALEGGRRGSVGSGRLPPVWVASGLARRTGPTCLLPQVSLQGLGVGVFTCRATCSSSSQYIRNVSQ